MRSWYLFFCLCLTALGAYAQSVQGYVLNKDTKMRLAKVYIYNLRSDEGVFNNAKGEFTIAVKEGDVLLAALEGYAPDTVTYSKQNAVYFQLMPLSIQIKEVEIKSIMLSPKERYAENRKEYKYGLDRGAVRDIFSLGNGGVGLSIDAIFNLLSRQGRNTKRLQAILERDYRESVIDYRFKPDVIARVLNIKNPEMKDFMQQYRPTYSFVLSATDYEFILFIKNSYASYKRSTEAFRLPDLPAIGKP